MEDLSDLKPKMKKYIIGKEVLTVSVSDAIRKERFSPIYQVIEVKNDDDD
jgi:hypothetical protein